MQWSLNEQKKADTVLLQTNYQGIKEPCLTERACSESWSN